MRLFILIVAFTSGLFFLTSIEAVAQALEREPGVPVVEAHRMEEDIQLDGHLDEPVWERTEPATEFLQQEPREGADPTERTEIHIAYDGSALYIGAMLYDSDPDGILAYQRRRNAGLGTDDRFMWILDTFGDGRSAYFFETNPAGLRGDGLLRTGQGFDLNKSWDGAWNARTARNDSGWSVEIRIPFSTLNFDPDLDAWGINFQRTVRRKNEEILWSGHRRNQGLFRPQHAGRLVGLEGLSQGLGLEVEPYAIASGRQDEFGPDGTSGLHADAGFDVDYSLTTNLRAALTVNTDFAEVEVDQRRVNLSRFPLFFPEQRDFFLEGSSVFNFAPRSGVTPYFSRRIGLVSRQPVPVRYGARLIGQMGDYEVGFLQVRTGRELNISGADFAVPSEDFTVARLKRNIFSESSIGLIYTRRASGTLDATSLPEDTDPLVPCVQDCHTLGADLEVETSSFLGHYNLQFQAFAVGHSRPMPGDTTRFMDRLARGLRINFPNDPFSGHMSYRELGVAYSPPVGFVQRNGFRRLQPSFSYGPYLEESDLIRQLAWSLRLEYLADFDFRPLTTEARLSLFDIRFESGERVEADVARQFERLRTPFDVLGDERFIVLPGDYPGWAWSGEVSTASYRPLSGEVEATYRTFWTGTRADYGLGISARPLPGVNLSAEWGHSRVDMPEGGFQTRLLRFEGNVDFTPNIFLMTSVQYDNLSELIGLYSRFRWILQPGSDLYLVYTHNWLNEPGNLFTLEREGAVKLSYTYRL